MFLTLSGTATDALNNPVKCRFRLVQKDTGTPYYNPVDEYSTDQSGNYSFDVDYGVYDIYLYTEIEKRYFLIATSIFVNSNTNATNINELIEQQ